MELYYTTVLFIFGTIFGSFFNVVGSRLPNGESIVTPPSHCTNCNHRLTWKELIPIVSFLLQGGKCVKCKQKISWFHPLYELATGILFALSYQTFGFSIELMIALTFVSTLMILIVSDYYYMIIPDSILMTGIVLLMVEIFIASGWKDLLFSVIDGFIAFVIMYFIKLFGDFLLKKESMGGGDIKLLFLFGLILGAPAAILSIFLSSFIALPISLLILYRNKTNIIPFGPFLSISAMILFFLQIDFSTITNLLLQI